MRLNNIGGFLGIAAVITGVIVIYNRFSKKGSSPSRDSNKELEILGKQNKSIGLDEPNAAHAAIANQIWENFNHAIVTDSNEDRIITLFRGADKNRRSLKDMKLIYKAYGVRRLPERVDFDFFSVGFSSGTLLQHVERIFDHSRKGTQEFIDLMNSVLT